MKIIYVLLIDDNGQHYYYSPNNLKSWIVPSINQCHILNPNDDIIFITDDSSLREHLPFVHFYEVGNYIDDDINWFKENYVHLSTNPFNFERNAIMRYMILRNFCVTHDISNFLHLETDVMVYSNVDEDANLFKDYNATLLHNKAAGCCFFNNAINVLNDFVQFVKNSYSYPQIDPMGFNMDEEKSRYKYNTENQTGAGGVSDMHFWSLYWYLNQNNVLGQMDDNFDGTFYQTCMIDQKLKGNWETTADNGIIIKKLNIVDNKCYGIFDGENVRIKYLHCHGHSKGLISKYSIK